MPLFPVLPLAECVLERNTLVIFLRYLLTQTLYPSNSLSGEHPHQPIIDWDLILHLESMTILGTATGYAHSRLSVAAAREKELQCDGRWCSLMWLLQWPWQWLVA